MVPGFVLCLCVCRLCFPLFSSPLFRLFSCLFSKEREGMELGGLGSGEDLGGVEGKGNCDPNILNEKIFSIK